MGKYKISKYVYVDRQGDIYYLYNTNKIDMIYMSKERYQLLKDNLESDALNVEQ